MSHRWSRGAKGRLGVSLALALAAVSLLVAFGYKPVKARLFPQPTFTATATATHTPTPSATASATPMPSATPTATRTATPTLTPSPTNSPTVTYTPTASVTPSPTASPTATATPTPQPTPDGVLRSLSVPILMYHYVSAPPPDADAVRRDLSVSPAQFEEQLRYLRDAGYVSISLRELTLALQTGQPLPEKPIIFTFDDGYRDAYDNAFPLLRRYGFTGTFFVITSLADVGHPDYLTWEQVLEMDAAGMAIEAHGYSHMDLRRRSVDYLVWQVLGAKEAIEARTGKPVRFFCYPSGKYDARVMQVLHSADYWGAVTLIEGVRQQSEHMFELQRIRVRGWYDVATLAREMEYLFRLAEKN